MGSFPFWMTEGDFLGDGEEDEIEMGWEPTTRSVLFIASGGGTGVSLHCSGIGGLLNSDAFGIKGGNPAETSWIFEERGLLKSATLGDLGWLWEFTWELRYSAALKENCFSRLTVSSDGESGSVEIFLTRGFKDVLCLRRNLQFLMRWPVRWQDEHRKGIPQKSNLCEILKPSHVISIWSG